MAAIDDIRALNAQLAQLRAKYATAVNALYKELGANQPDMRDLPVAVKTELRNTSTQFRTIAELTWNASYELPK